MASTKSLIIALDFATKAHAGQYRRGGDHVPYVHHCIGVKEILEQAGIYDANILSAALLHDTLEDCKQVTPQILQEQFGADITGLVLQLTDEPLEREERHRRQAQKIKEGMDVRAVMIKMADRLHNLMDFKKAVIQISMKEVKGGDNNDLEIQRCKSYARFSENLISAIHTRFQSMENNSSSSMPYQKAFSLLSSRLRDALDDLKSCLE